MKHLVLTSVEFVRFREGFRDWLLSLGYAETTVYNLPNAINELLHYLEEKGVISIDQITNDDLVSFWNELVNRPNERRGGGLSLSYLKKYDQAIKSFNNYLIATTGFPLRYQSQLPNTEDIKTIVYLTQKEIRMIYDALDNTTIMGMRDKAMMAVYYGCGLRKREGEYLDLKDVRLQSNLLHVREGKGNKERLVPMASGVVKDLQEYIIKARPKLLKQDHQNALFINERGKRISGQMMYKRLKLLVDKTSITKNVGLHTLRHSIATHLLQNGMSLEKIGKFLGHSSIESTQIYTHLSHE